MEKKRNFAIITCFLLALSIPAYAQTPWTGDGGKYTRVTVTEPLGKGLSSQQEQLLLPFIQSAIIGVFQKFSAMTVMDQFNLENVIKRQQLAIAGYFSDTDYIGIGNLTNARLVVFGSLTKIATGYMLEFTVMDVKIGQRKALYLPKQVSLWALENLSAIRTASADLLKQLGVELTSDAIQELTKSENAIRLQAENALAMGIIAQRQGMAIDALSYFFQAITLDPSLIGAIDRASVVSAAISSEDLEQEDVQNKLQTQDEWRTIITAARAFYANHLPYELIYNTDVNRGNITSERKTTNLSINISLDPTASWKTIDNLRQGLTKARQNQTWNFNLEKIEPRKIVVTIEIVNENDIVLAKASHTFTNPSETNQENAVLNFPNVKTDDITNHLTVWVVSINEIPAQKADETGYIRIFSFTPIITSVDSTQ